jgi:hypothetical protein
MKWAILIIACAILFFTNPSVQTHKSVVAREGMEILKQSPIDAVLSAYGGGEQLMVNAIKSATHRKNFYLFSLTEITMGDDSAPKTIGIGILGFVYIFPEVKQELMSQMDLLTSAAQLLLQK